MPVVTEIDQKQAFDYVIVGAGACGCVMANRLSKVSKVLLVESGGLDSSWELLAPGMAPTVWGMETFTHKLESVPQQHMKERKMATWVGKVLGGSGAINAMCWQRGSPWTYDLWQKEGR